MNQVIFSALKKQIILIIILTLTAILIWLRGPELVIGNFKPLSEPEQRCYAIIFIFLCWLLKFIFFDTNPHRKKSFLPLELQKKIDRLHGRFNGAVEFLKKTVIRKGERNVCLASLPWYLMIGPTNAGKTTMLANSNIHFILAKQFKSPHRTITTSDVCDWWVTRDIVVVDVPGAYLATKSKENPTGSHIFQILWRQLLSSIVKLRKTHLHGVVIALNLPEIALLPRLQKNQIYFDVKKRLQDLLTTFNKQLSVHLIITKCDLIPGFVEFFNESTRDEIAQAWGITLPPLEEHENLPDVLTQRFSALIKRLNKQLLPRLHQERNQNARPYIKDFPLYVEQLKEHIVHFIKALSIPELSLHSIHLTSGTQNKDDEKEAILATHLDFSTELQLIHTPPTPKKAYFVKQLFLQVLLAATPPASPIHYQKLKWQKRFAYTAALSAIVFASFLLGRDFKQGIKQAYSIQNDLVQYQIAIQNKGSDHLTKEALTLLNALQKAAHHAPNSLSLAFYTTKSQQTAQSVYEQSLQTIVIPEIKNYFEQYLRSAHRKKLENIYPIFEAYLMLGDKNHFQADFIVKRLQQMFPNTTNPKALDALSKHIRAALEKSSAAIKLDSGLIWEIRKEFLSLAKTDLAFILLRCIENYRYDQAIDVGTIAQNPPVLTSKGITPRVPVIYTGKVFDTIFNHDIPQIAEIIYSGNWVLGMNTSETNRHDIEKLTEEIRNLYLTKYIDIWESILANIDLIPANNLKEMDDKIGLLTSNTSPLLQLLNTIKQNTGFADILSRSPKLQSLVGLLSDANTNDKRLYEIFVNLRELHQYLQSMLYMVDTAQAIFSATAKRVADIPDTQDPIERLKNIAEVNPSPIKNWLQEIALKTESFLFSESATYIENAYQDDVLAFYHTNIMNHYPFNQEAALEVDLTHFTDFLGQPGRLFNFYQRYLKPFVNESQTKWTWRTAPSGLTLKFNNKILEQLQRAERIQHTFFPNGDNKLYVPFSLQPIALDKMMNGFTLNINGQEVRYDKEKPSPRLVVWPGNNTLHATTLNFVAMNNQLQSDSFNGNWAWFKLVTASTDEIRSRKELLLTFNVNGHVAKYALYTQGKMNPFLPLNLAHFALPAHL